MGKKIIRWYLYVPNLTVIILLNSTSLIVFLCHSTQIHIVAYYHQKSEPYPKDHEFEENDLTAITPNDIVRWMNVKAFGTAEPDENAQLVGSSWSSLGFIKKVRLC